MKISERPVAKTELLIRRPIEEVFEAFVDPAVTTKFWFTRSSGRLEAGGQVRWDWEMYGVHTLVDVVALEDDKRILVEWGESAERSTVEWVFHARPDHTTLVSITNRDFQGDGDAQVRQALDSLGGFTLVLCNLKALLEHGVDLNLIRDRFPDNHV